jgi:hypothetical protein
MESTCSIHIDHPREGGTVGQRFVASGTADGRTPLQAVLTKDKGAGTPVPVCLVPIPGTKRYHWYVALAAAAGPGTYRLTIGDKGGNGSQDPSVGFTVTPKHVQIEPFLIHINTPTIPPPPATFTVSGTDTNGVLVASYTLSPPPPRISKAGEVDVINSAWTITFSNLTAGTYRLHVYDATDPVGDTRTFTV